MSIAMTRARKRLAVLWFVASALVFLLVIAASINRDPATLVTLWSWFLPSITPTLSLIIGVLISEHVGRSVIDTRVADPFLLGLSTCLSVAYLALVAASLVFHLIGVLTLESSQLYLAPVQGLAATALSAFFLKKDGGGAVEPAADAAPAPGGR